MDTTTANGSCLGELRQTAGRLTSILVVIQQGKAYMQALYMLIAELVTAASYLHSSTHRAGRQRREHKSVRSAHIGRLPPPVLWELEWWRTTLRKPPPARDLTSVAGDTDVTTQDPDITITCDASGRALATVWGTHWARVDIPEHLRFSKQLKDKTAITHNTSSTLLELGALLLACCAWSTQWKNKHVLLLTDNASAVTIWRRRHSKHPRLAGIVRALTHYSSHHVFRLEVGWIPGVENVAADTLSRFNDAQFRDAVANADETASPLTTPHPLADWRQHFTN